MESREQFAEYPYPQVPIEKEPLADSRAAHRHYLGAAFYDRDGTLPSPCLTVLDAGCGTGTNTLAIALVNPEAAVVGIDSSPSSIAVANKRKEFHCVANVDFVVSEISDYLASGHSFDYINCADTLYLVDSPSALLRTFGAALRGRGMIHANLHNAASRNVFLRSQKALHMAGIAQRAPREAVEGTRAFFSALAEDVAIKRSTWRGRSSTDEFILQNHLLINDKGYSLDQVFSIINSADLAFVNLVDHSLWDLDLIMDYGKVTGIKETIDAMTRRDRLLLYDALNYNRRLYDFWCCRKEHMPDQRMRTEAWTVDRFMASTASLHPCLRKAPIIEALVQCVAKDVVFDLSRFVDGLGATFFVTPRLCEAMLVLSEGDVRVCDIVHRCRGNFMSAKFGSAEERVRHDLLRLEKLCAAFVQG